MFSISDTPQRNLFILSGENSTIPKGEIEALVKTYSQKTEISFPCSRVAIVNGPIDPTVITKRAAYVRLGGKYIDSMDLPLAPLFACWYGTRILTPENMKKLGLYPGRVMPTIPPL